MTANEFNRTLEKISGGDVKQIEKIYNEYYTKMVGAAFIVLHDKGLSENIASDTLIKVINKSANIKNVAKPDQYIYKMVHNAALDYLRTNHYPIARDINLDNGATEDFAPALIGKLDFYSMISKCKAIDQSIIIFRVMYSYSIKMIADELHLPFETVRTRLKAIKKTLKKRFKLIGG